MMEAEESGDMKKVKRGGERRRGMKRKEEGGGRTRK